MAKKKAKPKHAPLKPTTAWAVVDEQTGEIMGNTTGHGCFDGQFHTYRMPGNARRMSGERIEKVLITKP